MSAATRWTFRPLRALWVLSLGGVAWVHAGPEVAALVYLASLDVAVRR